MADSRMIDRLAALAASSEGGVPVVRGLLLYGAAGIVLLALIGILFSERFAVFIGWLPLAVALLVGLLLQPLSERRGLTWLSRPLGLALVLGYVVLGGLNAYVSARLYDGSQYDGAFQLFFPLRRIDQGEWPGKDFFYFHGQLIPVLVYPLYKLFGADFFAAQLAAKLVDLLMPLAYYLAFHWLGLDKGKSLLATVVLVGLLVTDRFTFGTQNPVDGIHIYALRSLIPMLYIAFLARNMSTEGYAQRVQQTFFHRHAPLQAALFVISFYLGSEQAFYLLAAMLLANLLLAGFHPLRVMVQSVWLILLAVGLLLLANLALFGSQQPLSYLGEISRNQTWFYGGYPNEFLHGALDFSRYRSSAYKVSAKLIVCILGLPFLMWLAFRLLPRNERSLFYFSLIGGAYGLIGLTSLTASYAGEQYTDNAIKVMLVGLIVLLTVISFRRREYVVPLPSTSSGVLSRLSGDLIAAAPLVLVVAVLVCVYSTLSVLRVGTNLRLLGVLDTPMFMSHPDLGVRLPFQPLHLKEDQRYHASQFLALEYALGNQAARIIYPEFSYVDGFDQGVKSLYRVRIRPSDIPDALAVGDFCAFDTHERAIIDIDRQAGYLSFGQPSRADDNVSHINCYRKQAHEYLALHGRRLILEQNIYDRYFYDGLYRGRQLQLRTKTEVHYRLRVGDFVQLGERQYRITAVHPNQVVVLDATDHPLPFAFDRGASFKATYSIASDNNFSYRLPVSRTERVVTRVLLNDQRVLADIAEHKQVFVARTSQAADVVEVDMIRGTLDLDGALKGQDLAYGLHLGEHQRADFQVIHETYPVFQLMKGIISAKQFGKGGMGSHIDFYFHTFSARLLAEYLQGLREADPVFISTPSGRYVNNFIWYDNWLMRARWPVFEHILSSYDPVAWSKFEVFWRKGAQHADRDPWQEVPISGDAQGPLMVLPTEGPVRMGDACQPTAYEVELDYEVGGWQRALPLLGGSTRHMAYIDDDLGVPLSFNPNEQRVRFPVFPSRGETLIRIGAVSPFGIDTTIHVQAARYRRLQLPADRIAAAVGKSALGSCP